MADQDAANITPAETKKIGELGTRTKEHIDAFLTNKFRKAVGWIVLGNILAVGAIAYHVSNTASVVATNIATTASNNAINKITESQQVSKDASAEALKVYREASNTFGRVSVLKEQLDDVEVKKITELYAKVKGLEDQLAKLTALLDERQADKRVAILKQLDEFKDGNLLIGLKDDFGKRFHKVEAWIVRLDLNSRQLDASLNEAFKDVETQTNKIVNRIDVKSFVPDRGYQLNAHQDIGNLPIVKLRDRQVLRLERTARQDFPDVKTEDLRITDLKLLPSEPPKENK